VVVVFASCGSVVAVIPADDALNPGFTLEDVRKNLLSGWTADIMWETSSARFAEWARTIKEQRRKPRLDFVNCRGE
jgi:hypothetical protein